MSLPRNTKNYVLSYDLNGPIPSHAQMDKHVSGIADEYGRILETVWYIRTGAPFLEVFEYLNGILTLDDRIVLIEASDMWMRNLLVPIPEMQRAWALAA